jgi:hypothetical protein
MIPDFSHAALQTAEVSHILEHRYGTQLVNACTYVLFATENIFLCYPLPK